MKPLQICLAIS